MSNRRKESYDMRTIANSTPNVGDSVTYRNAKGRTLLRVTVQSTDSGDFVGVSKSGGVFICYQMSSFETMASNKATRRTITTHPADCVIAGPPDTEEQWTTDPDTGADVWTPSQRPAIPTNCPRYTVAELATVAGTKAAIAQACGVAERTVAYWRAGRADAVPFKCVRIMAQMAGVSLDDVSETMFR